MAAPGNAKCSGALRRRRSPLGARRDLCGGPHRRRPQRQRWRPRPRARGRPRAPRALRHGAAAAAAAAPRAPPLLLLPRQALRAQQQLQAVLQQVHPREQRAVGRASAPPAGHRSGRAIRHVAAQPLHLLRIELLERLYARGEGARPAGRGEGKGQGRGQRVQGQR
jgi:hypothetical protein